MIILVFLILIYLDNTHFNMHLSGLNATAHSDDSFNRLKNMISVYCPIKMDNTEDIDIIRICRRFAFKEFNPHYSACYYDKDGKVSIPLYGSLYTPNKNNLILEPIGII